MSSTDLADCNDALLPFGAIKTHPLCKHGKGRIFLHLEKIPMDTLLVLGTGAARATRYYNTCFMLLGKQGHLMVDAGGGNGILRQLDAAGFSLERLTDLFVTHEHIDHTLGVLWIVRMVSTLCLKGKRSAPLNIHCHARLAEKLKSICLALLSARQCRPIGTHICFRPVADGETREIAGHNVTFFDIHSSKAEQYGFRMQSGEGQTIVCCGDEPLPPSCHSLARGADWLLHESFCLECDEPVFTPHDKMHGTVREAAQTAHLLGVKNLVLWHTEDSSTYGCRKQRYTEAAAQYFRGGIFVPDDLEAIRLDAQCRSAE